MKLVKSIVYLKLSIMMFNLSICAVFSLESPDKVHNCHDGSHSPNQRQYDDAVGIEMMKKLYGLPTLTKNEQEARVRLNCQIAIRRDEANQYLKENRIAQITKDTTDAVIYLQDYVQKLRPSREDIISYLSLTGSYIHSALEPKFLPE